jgi:hypothetical protein
MSKRKERRTYYGLLMGDMRISDGAFRLWHCLLDYRNPATGICWPGQRTIQEDIGCKAHSIRAWLVELVQSGWLEITCNGEGVVIEELQKPQSERLKERKHRLQTPIEGRSNAERFGRRYTYRLLNGSGEPLPKKATLTVAKKGNAFDRGPKGQRGVAGKGNGPLPKWATEVRGDHKGPPLTQNKEIDLYPGSDARPADAPGTLPDVEEGW